MTTDPIQQAIDQLPDEKISPKRAQDIQRRARFHFEGRDPIGSRVDRFLMDRFMPAMLSAVVVWYGIGLIQYFQRIF